MTKISAVAAASMLVKQVYVDPRITAVTLATVLARMQGVDIDRPIDRQTDDKLFIIIT